MDIKHIAEHQFPYEVLKSDRIVIVDFWAPWCAPCRAMEPILISIANRFPREVQIIKVNIDDEDRLAAGNRVMSIPTILIFKNGNVVDNFVGSVTELMISNAINKQLAK